MHKAQEKRVTESETQVSRVKSHVAADEASTSHADRHTRDSVSSNDSSIPKRGRPTKQQYPVKKSQSQEKPIQVPPAQPKIIAESFVMKLFDRSLDLSNYREDTPLYPVCRAWMKNQPRNSKLPSFRERMSPPPSTREDNAEEVLEKLRNGEITTITKMPAIKPEVCAHIPPPLDFDETHDITLDDLEKDMVVEVGEDGEEKPTTSTKPKDYSKDELLDLHKNRWKKVKSHWLSHTQKYNQRFEVNRQILEHLFERKS